MSDKTPAQVEAEGDDTVTVDWDGVPVTVPASAEDLDLDAIEAFETGKAVTALRAMVGSKEYDRLRADYAKANGHRPKVADLGNLMTEIAKAYGFDTAGN